MIIPICFTLIPTHKDLLYTWIFHKGISFSKQYGWPVFAQMQYFHEWDAQERMGYMNPAIPKMNDYDPISKSDFERVICEEFPQDLVEAYMNQFPSQTDAYLASMKEAWPEMTTFMVEQVHQCEQKTGEKAEAFWGMHMPRFVHDAAKELGIETINFEWGPFRNAYRNTAYLDFKGSICDGEMLERYAEFQKISYKVPILRKKEILSLFLIDEKLGKLSEPDVRPVYKLGIASGYSIPVDYNVHSMVNITEAVNQARRYFSDSEICVRYHPADPVHIRVDGPQQDNGELIDFIRKCERVASMFSGVGYEAMLWNRPSYELATSMYGVVSNHKLEGLPDVMVLDDFLSFIAFGYLIPFEMLKNVEYLRWRLGKPNEEEIYLYHLKYYLACLDIPMSVLDLQGENRLERIMCIRNSGKKWDEPNEFDWKDCSELTKAYIRTEQLKYELEQQKSRHEAECASVVQQQQMIQQELTNTRQELLDTQQELLNVRQELTLTQQGLVNMHQEIGSLKNALANENQRANQFEQEYRALTGSRSWKMTEPLRAAKRGINRLFHR